MASFVLMRVLKSYYHAIILNKPKINTVNHTKKATLIKYFKNPIIMLSIDRIENSSGVCLYVSSLITSINHQFAHLHPTYYVDGGSPPTSILHHNITK